MSLIEVHGRLAYTGLYFIILMAFWGLWRFLRKQGPDSNYWGALIIGELLILVQGALGAYLFVSGHHPGRSIHLLYGIASALVIPGVYAYTKGAQDRRTMLIYAVALLFLVGLIIRAMTTAAGTSG